VLALIFFSDTLIEMYHSLACFTNKKINFLNFKIYFVAEGEQLHVMFLGRYFRSQLSSSVQTFI